MQTRQLHHYFKDTSAKVMRLNKSNVYQLLMMFLGFVVIGLAVLSFFTDLTLAVLLEKMGQEFSRVFLLVFSMLVLAGTYAITKLKANTHCEYWCEFGMQTANGVSTLALTFTLLGISLGIGSLAEQPLTADNVQLLIGDLTKNFSMAFMTTVVGLPTSALIRAIVAIKYQRIQLLQVK